jgi:catechol 2,3-dioxygenase-like lactoylglutathione lyase family enzyme
VIGHLGLNVSDLGAAKRYYHDVMPLVGFEPYVEGPDELAYRPAHGKPGTYLWLYQSGEPGEYSRERVGLQHLAFMVRARSDVDLVHERARALGSEVLIAPRHFAEYPQPYYATFWIDPFGFKLEAVCHYDRA